MQKPILIMAMALFIGLTANFLLHDQITSGMPIGLAIPLLTEILSIATIIIAFKSNMPLGHKGLYFLLPAVIFSQGFVFRDSHTLLAIDLSVVFLSLTFTTLSLTGKSLTTAGITEYGLAILNGALIPVVNAADMFSNYVQWDSLLPPQANQQAKAVSRGLAIGIPITAIFFALFVSADAAFAAIAEHSIKFDLGETATSGIIVFISTWLTTGYFHTFALSKFSQEHHQLVAQELGDIDKLSTFGRSSLAMINKPGLQLGVTEIATVLALVNLLFLSFVIVQLKFLFGGASLVELTPGLSFSEYARKGFFDINIAAALVLPLLLTADHLLKRTSQLATYLVRAQSITLIALLSVVMASAMMRMHLYQIEYGQSELRLYTTAFMVWLGLVCAIFSGTVLMGRRQFFAFGGFGAGLLVIGVLHLINPDAMIERANLSHAKTGLSFDANYALSLSNDAVPVLVKNIGGLNRSQQRLIAKSLVSQNKGAWHTDLRSFNFSRMQAFQAVAKNLPELQKLAKENK